MLRFMDICFFFVHHLMEHLNFLLLTVRDASINMYVHISFFLFTELGVDLLACIVTPNLRSWQSRCAVPCSCQLTRRVTLPMSFMCDVWTNVLSCVQVGSLPCGFWDLNSGQQAHVAGTFTHQAIWAAHALSGASWELRTAFLWMTSWLLVFCRCFCDAMSKKLGLIYGPPLLIGSILSWL